MARTLFSRLMFITIIMMFSIQGYAKSTKPNVLGMYESQVNILGVDKKDEYDFKELVKRAESHHNIKARVQLGDVLYYGNDLIRDEKLALDYWKKASSSSNSFKREWVAKANFRLAKYYFHKDRKLAERHLIISARLGNSEADMMLFIINKQTRVKNKEGQNA